nr:hypothetical protein CFP56_52820 [Quercus suber]
MLELDGASCAQREAGEQQLARHRVWLVEANAVPVADAGFEGLDAHVRDQRVKSPNVEEAHRAIGTCRDGYTPMDVDQYAAIVRVLMFPIVAWNTSVLKLCLCVGALKSPSLSIT